MKYKNIADQTTPDITSRFVRDEYMVNMQSLSLSYDFTPEICQKLYLSRLRVEFLMNDVFRASTISRNEGFRILSPGVLNFRLVQHFDTNY